VLAGLAHDVRSIGAAAEGLAFRASTRVRDDARLSAYLEAIRESMERLVVMASGALDFVEAGSEAHREPRAVRLDQAVVSVIAACGEDAAARGVRLAVRALPAVVMADRSDVFRLTLNLVSNAITHGAARRGGLVRVRVSTVGRIVVLAISDGGPGFPLTLLGDGPRLPTFLAGHGLGLSIVDGLARKHGAFVRLRNLRGGCALVVFPTPHPLSETA